MPYAEIFKFFFYQVKIGQRKYLSGMDILQMNLLYKCR